MNILMFTNTFTPHVGGVACSVQAFTDEFRRLGHRVIVVAPEFEGRSRTEHDIVRIPAIQKFNGSDFSVRLPVPANAYLPLSELKPDIIHSHHPFLLGDTALRIASMVNAPIVFTHHTMYERYTHYVPGDSPALRHFVIELSTGYANLCQAVIAPSASVKQVLEQRGVVTPVHVIPTGIQLERFKSGERARARARWGISDSSYVVGHLGRLAPEKNLIFLAHAVSQFLRSHPGAVFLLVGEGPLSPKIREIFESHGMADRLILAGSLQGSDVVDAYYAMDVFAFASQTETQGIVLAEAMAAGVPVVALDASGAREVVRDKENGRLLSGQSKRGFVAALQWIYGLSASERGRMAESARETAEQLSLEVCAKRAISLYESLAVTPRLHAAVEESAWLSSLRYIETEWNLNANRAQSAGRALWRTKILRAIPYRQARAMLRRIRRRLSRTEFEVRALGLRRSDTTPENPGLVLLQIDGLARTQFEHALRQGKLPFLRRLASREHYTTSTMYSGLPSATPAVQGELFYGKRTAVPAFAYYKRSDERLRIMFEISSVTDVEKDLAHDTEGLLTGGSCYSDIYTGGASESHFCPATFGWGHIMSNAKPWTLATMIVLHSWSIVRTAVLMVVEVILAIVDCIQGSIAGERLPNELRFIPTRVSICIMLREMITAGVLIDVARGLPIIHANFLGYDEQSHRRGPDSQFAHWSLKGIDNAIKRIFLAARRSGRRDYEIWIYADHGQDAAASYVRTHKRYVSEVLEEIFGQEKRSRAAQSNYEGTGELERAHWIGGRRLFQWLLKKPIIPALGRAQSKLRVAAAGPLGHVYYADPLDDAQRLALAEKMVAADIPLVLFRTRDGAVKAVNLRGVFELPEDIMMVAGDDHPFAEEIAEDLLALVRHPDAGDFVICGWMPGSRPVTFPFENGGHGGIGVNETRAFVFLPERVQIGDESQPYWRPADLRRAALSYLHRLPESEPLVSRPRRRAAAKDYLRVVTYNVHSCVGMDGMLSPRRVMRVLAEYNPDVVALQELDVGRARTEHEDQAHTIARALEMELQFNAALQVEEERYGDAILSRLPLKLVRAAPLPGLPNRPHLEPRGAVWVSVELNGIELHLINTHLGLVNAERKAQVRALLGSEWIGSDRCDGPLILCGDMNALPGSGVYRRFAQQLSDVERLHPGKRRRMTWPSRYPCSRIDYVFTRALAVRNVFVPHTELTKIASDHLPVVVDIELPR